MPNRDANQFDLALTKGTAPQTADAGAEEHIRELLREEGVSVHTQKHLTGFADEEADPERKAAILMVRDGITVRQN